MSRPRKVTSRYCIRCTAVWTTPEERQQQAEHRLAHQRLDRRRYQWRESAERRRLRERGESTAVGYLHNLGCTGGHVLARGKCLPIACYRIEEEAA